MSVHKYIRPSIHKKFLRFQWNLACRLRSMSDWRSMVCSMTRSKVKVKVTSPWKLEILPFSTAVSSAIYNGADNWPLVLKVVHNIYIWFGRIFDIYYIVLVFVSRDFELGRNVSCEQSTVSPAQGLIYYTCNIIVQKLAFKSLLLRPFYRWLWVTRVTLICWCLVSATQWSLWMRRQDNAKLYHRHLPVRRVMLQIWWNCVLTFYCHLLTSLIALYFPKWMSVCYDG